MCWQGFESSEILLHFDGNVQWSTTLEKEFALKVNFKISYISIHISCNPEIPHLGICSREIEASSQENWNTNAHNSFFFFFFLQNSQNVKQAKYLSGRKKEQIVVDPYNRLFLGNKKQEFL